MTSPLPEELWHEILPLAVHVPGLLATKWDFSLDEQMWQGWERMEISKESLATRRAIVQVSRGWWRIGKRFLYEALDLRNPNVRGLENLAALFEQSGKSMVRSEEYGDESRAREGYGWWVTRIKLDLQWLQIDTFPSLLRLVSACHNIQIVVVHGDIQDADLSLLPQLTDILQSRFTHSLRRLSYWFPDAEYVDSAEFRNFPNLPLDSASFCLSRFPALPTNVAFTPLALSTLSSLEILIPTDIGYPPNALNLPAWTLPALRYIYISGLRSANIPHLFHFMEINGPQLIGLRLEGTAGSDYEDIPKLLEFTSVQSFVLDDFDFEFFRPANDPTYPSVTYIGLLSVSPSLVQDDSLRITRGLAYILPRQLFPHLHTMRILEEGVPTVIDKYWRKAIGLAAEHGIRLENHQCRMLSDIYWSGGMKIPRRFRGVE